MSSAVVKESASAVADSVVCKWWTDCEITLMHQTGWAISRYAVCEEWCYVPREQVSRCGSPNGPACHGLFDDARDAMQLHRWLALHGTK